MLSGVYYIHFAKLSPQPQPAEVGGWVGYISIQSSHPTTNAPNHPPDIPEK